MDIRSESFTRTHRRKLIPFRVSAVQTLISLDLIAGIASICIDGIHVKSERSALHGSESETTWSIIVTETCVGLGSVGKLDKMKVTLQVKAFIRTHYTTCNLGVFARTITAIR